MRAGVDPHFVDRVVDLGIVAPAQPGRFSPGDVRRMLMAKSLEDAAIPLDSVAEALDNGSLSLTFLDASAYERLGERAAFSFPLVSVAAARRGSETRLVAAGVANVPRELDPADPLAGLPGNPQTGWKRRALETLVGRALSALG